MPPVSPEKAAEYDAFAKGVVASALANREELGHKPLKPEANLPGPARGNVHHWLLPLLMPVLSYGFIIACYFLPFLRAGFPFLCLIIEGFFTPFHWGFVVNCVKLSWPYKRAWLLCAFAMELIPIVGIHFITPPLKIPFHEPFGLPVWEYSGYLHLVIHVSHAAYVLAFQDPPELYAQNPFSANWPGRIYVFFDAAVHTAICIRLILITNPYEPIFAGVVWLSALMEMDHRWFLETTAEFVERVIANKMAVDEKEAKKKAAAEERLTKKRD